MVGIDPRTGKRWRNGRRITSGGRVLDLPPVITSIALAVKRYSPRYLSEDERVRLADLRRERRTMREIAALMGRSPSTISRELARGADTVRSLSAVRGAPACAGRVAACIVPAVSPAMPSCATGSPARLLARWSPEQVARGLRRRYPDQPERWLCAETIYQAVYRPDLGGLPRELPGRVLRHRRRHRVPRRQAQARRSGPGHRHDPHPRASRRGARPRRARPLGGRPDHGCRQRVGDRHPRRAHHPVHAAGPPARRRGTTR